MNTQPIPAILVLADGSVFKGTSLGKTGLSIGEVVFNTSMTGYQEILTDPSYAQQMITLTYPHIGNTGCNDEDCESDSVFATGLIIRDYPIRSSNFRSQQDLGDFLRERNIVAIADVDTRRLTRLLREQGAQAGCIMAGEDLDVAKAQQAAQSFPGLAGMDLAKVVSADESYQWTEGGWQLGQGYQKPAISNLPYHVVAYDYGIKRNILRLLVDQGCRVTVLPAQTPASDVLALKPDGIFLSNGPGDPEPCDYAIKAISELLETGVPMFGICLGHQLLALACGARTEKMKFGHHGANHPVQDLHDGRVMITSQNHGFAVAEDSLPSQLIASHKSLFDNSLQGVKHRDKPAFSFQGHPEASPGPRDIQQLFVEFVEMIATHKSKSTAVANNA